MDAAFLSTVAGSVLSLAFSYVPSLKDWYSALKGQGKALVMLVVLGLTSISLYITSCFGYYVVVTCDEAGAVALAKLFFAALIANQSTYLMTRRL